MTTKGPIPEAMRNLSISETRDLMTGVADIKAERDTARAEAAALRAEVEAMREVVEAARFAKGGGLTHSQTLDWALEKYALRTRKGGG